MLEQFYREHRQGLFSLALAVTESRSLAEDAVHEAFVQLCRHDSLQPIRLRPYVYAAVRNAAIDLRRRRRRQDDQLQSIFNGYVPPSAPVDPVGNTLTLERDRLLREAVAALAPVDREIVTLKAFAELTFEEIGQITQTPMKTVATKYRRALGKLEQRLREQYEQ